MIGISGNLLIQVVTDHPFLTKFSEIVLLGLGLIVLFASFSGDFLISRYKLVLIGSYASFLLLIPLTIIVTLKLPTHLVLVFQILCILSVIATVVVRVNLLPFDID